MSSDLAPETWARAGHFFDLADYLTWKASGSTARSECTLTCKWTYLAHESPGWQRDFLAEVGVEDLVERGGLPIEASPIGQAWPSCSPWTVPPRPAGLPLPATVLPSFQAGCFYRHR